MTAEPEALIVKGWTIDEEFLQERSVRRCGMGECSAWCCGMGVWVDSAHAERVLEHREMIKPYLPEERRDETRWFDGDTYRHGDFPSGSATGTAVTDRPDHPLGQACTFLRADYRCALQMAGAENGMGRWGLKPFFCALHPLTYHGDRHLRLDSDNEIYHGGGTCQRVQLPWQEAPMYELMADELKLVLGEDGYQELADHARARRAAKGEQA